ncbi:MAG: nucleotide exchange factor GrpE [Deltaproteobacteria bacterium]|nr:nucleotide exchange factor GrpE [Deltaproteobacteria bacterium]
MEGFQEEIKKEESEAQLMGNAEEKTASEGMEKEDVEKKEIPLEKMTKAQLLKKVREVQESVDKNFDLYLRSQAEIENLKRRFKKEKEDLAKYANESLIKRLLTVMDNLQNAVTHSRDKKALKALGEGVELTLKGLMDALEKAGLEQVQAQGEPFDPNFHEAVSEREDDASEAGTVLQELQKGYILNQRLIRPAMVVVSKRPA